MAKPLLHTAGVRCAVHGCYVDAVKLVAPGGNEVYWCQDGHVSVVPGTNHDPIEVFNFHEYEPS